LVGGQAFDENISNLPAGKDISHNEITISNPLSDKIIINNNMIATIMLNWIGRHVGSTNIVAVEMNSIANDNPQIENNFCIQIVSATVYPRARYSALVKDLETVGCFLECQLVRLGPK